MKTLLIATRNRHKVGEIQDILGAGYEYRTLEDFPDAPEVVEDAETFAGNASKKALALAEWLVIEGRIAEGGLLVLADDSGLEVDALKGAPGVYSARYAAMAAGGAGNSSDADNNARLLRELAETPEEKRTARFRCVVALVEVKDGVLADALVFDGACEGRIDFAPRGEGGFGYDPLFVPDGYEQSFAELGAEVKNRLSHRARALANLRQALAV